MTKNLSKSPKQWLTLDGCKDLYENFREKLSLDEPIPPFDTRFEGKLEGILESIKATFDGEPLNQTIADAATAYFNQIIRGHPFLNGNKRMAVLFTHYFLYMHDLDFDLSFGEMFNFAVTVSIAGVNGIDSEATKEWINSIIKKYAKDR